MICCRSVDGDAVVDAAAHVADLLVVPLQFSQTAARKSGDAFGGGARRPQYRRRRRRRGFRVAPRAFERSERRPSTAQP